MSQLSTDTKLTCSNFKDNMPVNTGTNDSSSFNYLNINFTGIIPSSSETNNAGTNSDSSTKEGNEENTKM